MKYEFARARGFTLIELMIVVAVIGVLAAIALPQYRDYLVRSRWSDNLSSAGQIKQAIGECMQVNANPAGPAVAPCDSIANMIPPAFLPVGFTIPATVNLVSGTYTASALVLTGTAVAGSCTVTVTPTSNANAVTWAYVNGGGCTRSRTGVGT